MSHNLEIYGRMLSSFGINGEFDRKYLANKLSNAYRGRYCIDNYRVCKSDEDKQKSAEYLKLQEGGCCGFYDEFVYNPTTDNYFWIGFNYGH